MHKLKLRDNNFNGNDIISILLFQKHLSNVFRVKLIKENINKIDKWDLNNILINSNLLDKSIKSELKVIMELLK